VKIDSIVSGSENGFIIIERAFSSDDRHLSLGIANLHAVVPDIEANKDKMLGTLEVSQAKKVNLAIFPEFCLSGYFWVKSFVEFIL